MYVMSGALIRILPNGRYKQSRMRWAEHTRHIAKIRNTSELTGKRKGKQVWVGRRSWEDNIKMILENGKERHVWVGRRSCEDNIKMISNTYVWTVLNSLRTGYNHELFGTW
jgi:hypothetical protein